MKRAIAVLAAAMLGLAGTTAAKAAEAPACNRACLEGFVDKYMDALVAHDPHRLPLGKGARFTEDGQTLALSDGPPTA